MSTLSVRHRTAPAIALAVPLWISAAAGVIAIDIALQHSLPVVCVAAKVIVIVCSAFAYMRLAAHDGSVNEGLAAGVVWTVLSIVAEVALASKFHTRWYPLFGSPALGAFRNILLFAWIGAPAMFARSES